jgi:hypothetical protein
MADLGFLFGVIAGTILFRALSLFIVKKIGLILPEKKMLWGYGLALIALFIIPAIGMADGEPTLWAIGLTTYIPILGLFFLWDLKKAGKIDQPKLENGLSWNRGIMRLWGIIFIPAFLLMEFSAYTDLMDAKYVRNEYATYAYERAFSDAINGYLMLFISLGVIVAIKWVIQGFKTEKGENK